MLATILKHAQGQPQVITEWTRYVNTIELRTSIYMTRFMAGPFFYSPFVKLVKQILHDVDVSSVLKHRSDFAKYQQIYFIATSFRSMFDPLYLSREYGKIFTMGKTPDYVLHVMSDTPMTMLPLDKPWPAWNSVHPVRIVHHDALELVADLNKFSIEFKGPKPTRLVGTMDLVLLIFKYIKYVEMCQEMGTSPEVEDYIHHQLMPIWFHDLRNIWLFNLLQDLMFSDKPSPTKYHVDNVISPVSAIMGVRPDISRIQTEFQRKNLTIGEFLATPWFGVGCSLLSWIRTIRTQLCPPNLNQYTHLRFLEEIPYAGFVMRMKNLAGDRRGAMINREIYQMLLRYHNNNVYAAIQHPELKQRMIYEVGQLMAMAKRYHQYV